MRSKSKADLIAEIKTLQNRIHDLEVRAAVQAETAAALGLREQEINILLEHCPDVIARFDSALRHLYVSPSVQAVTGLAPQVFIGKTNREVGMSQELVERWEAALRRVFETGQEVRLEFAFPSPAGPRHYESCLIPERAEDGSVETVLSTTRDVTEWKRLEETLRESEAQYRSLFENSIDAVLLAAPDGKILAANPEACRLFGRSEEEICQIGRPGVVDVTDPRLPILLEERERTGKCKGELTFVRGDGTKFPGEISSAVFTGQNGLPRTSTIIRDITDRKGAQERLTKLNECLLSLGVDPTENINRLVTLCGEQLGASCAFYNRLEEGRLRAVGQWNAPADFFPVDTPDGHICYDLIRGARSNLWVIRNLPQTDYARTDPNVLRYGLQTYVGKPVSFGSAFVGSLCVLYCEDRLPGEEDAKLLGIVASVIGVEEERERAEKALRTSEERFRLVARATNDAIWDWDLVTNRLWWSEGVKALFGYSVDETRVDITWWNELIHPQERERVVQGIHAVIDGGERFWLDEYRCRCADGSYALVVDRGHVMHDDNGRPVRMIGAMMDITERKRAEEALRESEERFDMAVEASSDGIWDWPDLSIPRFRWSPQFCSLLGYRTDELDPSLTTFMGLLHPDDRDRIREEMSIRTTATEPFESEYRLLTKSGEYRWFSARGKVWRDRKGTPVCMIGSIRDITERKRAEEELDRSRAELKAIYDHAPVMMCVMDRDRHVLYANRMFTEFTGVPEDHLQAGHACGAFGCVSALTDPRGCGFGSDSVDCSLRMAIEETWETGWGHRNIERRLMLERDGIRREVVLLGATALIRTVGQSRLLLCLQDITERKGAEEALRALSRRRLEMQEEERRLLARELHDEIGQLLTGLKLTLEMVTGQGTESGQDALRESRDLVGELIGHVRELSLTLRPPILDDLGLLPALLWMFNRYTARTQIRVDFEHTGLEGRPCGPEVETAAYRIVQEALTNVARYATVDAAQAKVWIQGGMLLVRIEDHGRGFEPTLTLTPLESSGLMGMRERATLLGGRLYIESSPGAGTSIMAELPLMKMTND